ncbi:MAG: tetratricopeptide repeat protein [Fibrobacteres bacterium]|nr:tetratricopeptide repeat protein [Fibrobacterota bacterium]
MTSLDTLEGISRTRPGGLGFSMHAEALLRAGRAEQAEQVVHDGLSRWPRSLTGRILRGKIAIERGDFELARASFQAAVDLDGACRAALEGLAESSSRAQYLRQAFEVWGRLAALEPDHPKASAQVRALAQSLDRPTGLDPVNMVRDQEDARSREALSEGATSLQGMSSMSAPIPAFHLDMGDSPSASGFSSGRMEAATIPELPGFQPSSVAPPPSASLLGRVEESSFATLEMPSFTPGRTIPPPPLEMPVAPPSSQVPASEFATAQFAPPVVPGRFPSAQDQMDAEATQFLGSTGAATQSFGRVQGDDIGDRMDALFGETPTAFAQPEAPVSAFQPAETPPTAVDFPVVKPVSDKVTGKDVAGRLDELFGESSVPAPPSVAPAPMSAQPIVSGDDIEGRLDDLFAESVIDLTSPISEAPRQASSSDTSTMPREAMMAPPSFSDAADTAAVARDTTIEAQLPVPRTSRPAESTAELMALSSVDISSFEATRSTGDARGATRLTAEDVDSRLDELFASSEFQTENNQGARRTGFVPRNPSAAQNQVTGDDIEGRLDDLFGGDSDFPVGLPTVTFAEEYLRQGHRDKAASIYRQLLEKDPSNDELRRRLNDIEGQG